MQRRFSGMTITICKTCLPVHSFNGNTVITPRESNSMVQLGSVCSLVNDKTPSA